MDDYDYGEYTDAELADALRELDAAPDVDVSTWEANFIEDMCFGDRAPTNYTAKQRGKIIQILKKYN